MNTLYLYPSGLSAKMYFEREKGSDKTTLERYLNCADSTTLQKASAELNLLHLEA